MIGCVVLAFALCNPQYGAYGYSQAYAGSYAQGGYYQQQPQVYVVQPPPVYYAQPVYVQQPIYGYGGGYGNQYPFAGMGGLSVAVGPRGGVRVGLGR